LARTGFRSQRPQELTESAAVLVATAAKEAFHKRNQRAAAVWGGASSARRLRKATAI